MIGSLLKYRRLYVVLVNLAIVAAANYAAFWLRFDGAIPADEYRLWLWLFPWICGIQALSFIPFRLYEGLWRYTSISDIANILFAVCFTQILVYFVVYVLLGAAYSRGALINDAVLLVLLLSGVRMLRRLLLELAVLEGETRVLIFGTGAAAEMIVRQMRNDPGRKYEPVGLVAEHPGQRHLRIRGVEVVGTRADMSSLMAAVNPDEVLIAMPEMDAAERRALVKALQPFRVPIKTLPAISEMLNGTSSISDIRDLSLEDLLPRPPVGLDERSVHDMIRGKRVMVTGAGGSIGSELCRQIAQFNPQSLIMLDRYENGLYAVGNELGQMAPRPRFQLVIGDVGDATRMAHLFSAHRPEIVFHAAAHKHVPLMEANPCEAVKNNVIGTRIVAQTARQFGARRFILISTDKAVNPSSVMGACKRVAELMLQSMGEGGATALIAVRFGNVLGSNGSVVPLFLEQIKAGGPVTVTHPQMRRFFMLIPEAVQLVLHGAALGEHGALYVLEMGEQIPLVEIARNLIRLSGHIPDQDIPIVFTGTRPGEKLYEELVGTDETSEPSGISKILRVRSRRSAAPDGLMVRVEELERAALANDTAGVLERLSLLVGGLRHLDEPLAEGAWEWPAVPGALAPVAPEFALQRIAAK